MENQNKSPLDQLREINNNINSKPSDAPAPQVKRAPVAPNTVRNNATTNVQREVVTTPKPIPRGANTAPQRTVVNSARPIPNTQRPAPVAQNNTAQAQKQAQSVPNPQAVKPQPQNTSPVVANPRVSGGENGDTISVQAVRPTTTPRNTTPKPVAKPTAPATQKPQAQKSTRQKTKKVDEEDRIGQNLGHGVIRNSVKAVIYIVCVFVVSGILALFAIFVGNDALALVKDDFEITVTIPEGADLDDIAKILGENDIINYPSMFKLYLNLRHKTADEYLHGEFVVSPSMSYDTLITKFKHNAGVRTEISITFTEGMTVDNIIGEFVKNGIGTTEGFVDVIQNYDFSEYWFVAELDETLAKNPDSGRKYRLEGYLFPDTYNFYSDSSESDCIKRLLDNFDAKFDDAKKLRCEELGMTCDEVVTLASMIQKEAKFATDYQYVSSVFHNRLNSNATNGKLESNATVQYTMPEEEVELKLTDAQIHQYDNAYNTYLYPGLPVGPITNPSLNAINFALYPADTNYYYFVSNSEGYNLYAKSSSEHSSNIAKVESEG